MRRIPLFQGKVKVPQAYLLRNPPEVVRTADLFPRSHLKVSKAEGFSRVRACRLDLSTPMGLRCPSSTGQYREFGQPLKGHSPSPAIIAKGDDDNNVTSRLDLDNGSPVAPSLVSDPGDENEGPGGFVSN
jgi:hypothetical protein